MRKLFLLGIVALAAVAAAQISIQATPTATLTCSSGGGTAATVLGGSYQFTVTGADSYLCRDEVAATCASGGVLYPVGTLMTFQVTGASKSYACRSAASIVQFTRFQ